MSSSSVLKAHLSQQQQRAADKKSAGVKKSIKKKAKKPSSSVKTLGVCVGWMSVVAFLTRHLLAEVVREENTVVDNTEKNVRALLLINPVSKKKSKSGKKHKPRKGK